MSILQVELRASKNLAALLCLIHGGAIAVLCCLPIPGWAKLIAILFCLGDLSYLLRLHILRNLRSAIIKFSVNPDLEWHLIDSQGQSHFAALQGNSFISAYLIILNFKLEDSRLKKSVVIMRDSVGPDIFRRLSVHLRLYQQFAKT